MKSRLILSIGDDIKMKIFSKFEIFMFVVCVAGYLGICWGYFFVFNSKEILVSEFLVTIKCRIKIEAPDEQKAKTWAIAVLADPVDNSKGKMVGIDFVCITNESEEK